MEVKVDLGSIPLVIKGAGADPNGDVQKFLTNTINRRMGRYMPHVTGALETKQKRIVDPTTIEVVGPQVRYLYNGVKMVNSVTGKGPFYIKDVGFRYRKGTKLKATNEPLNYTKTFNPQAGPFWDRRMMAAESEKIAKEVSHYANRP